MVEWKELGEVAKLVRGKVISKDYIRDFEGEYPVYSSQTANDGVLGNINSYMFDGDYLTWTTDGAYAGTIFRRKGKFSITNVCGLIDITCSNIKQDFLYFWLSKTAKNYVLEGMGNPKLMSNVASTIPIPIPSLKEQIRIVGILDTFTASIDNLKQQIAQRRKQYEYYRDQLLDLEGKEGVEMKTLGEACEIRRGIRVVKKQLKDNALYPVFQNSIAPMGYYDQFNRDGNIPYIICAGSSSGSVGFCCTPFWAADDCYTIESSKVNRRYTYYALKKNNNYLFKLVRKGSMPRLPHEAIDNMIIPIPSLSEQSRIVSNLDTFEASIQNLEAQLSQREKQYEYYRNKLLTFE